ncbi:uncharacterized protein dlgap2a isoform 1-T1 [Synchiropus picturatus]
MSALKKVLPGLLQKHCCVVPDGHTGVKKLLMKLKSREIYSESQCMLCGEPEDQQYSWLTSQPFDEDSNSSSARNMKGLSGRPAHLQLTSPTSAHTCGLLECDHSLDHHLHHGDSRPPSYLLSPTESCPLDGHRRCSPRSSIHSECMVIPVSMSATDSMSSSTFPRMHYGSASRGGGVNSSGGRESRDDASSMSHGGSGKMNRIPATLLDQFEKQMPLHRDGFHTLQYQRTSTTTTTTEQRNESPGRIRHLVHSVQKLFTKSHSLEGKMNGTKSDSHRDSSHHHHHHQSHHKHSKRSKSKERKSDGSGKHRSGGWWSSDDNLDSDSTYRTPSVMSRHPVDHISHCYPDSVHSHLAGELSLKGSKSNNDVKCSACESVNMAPEGKFMKRSSWSTLTVSQAKEAYRKSSLNLEKPMTPSDLKPNIRPCHYLQVPQDEWGGYPGDGKDDEIPCRRMRSSSYVKAMGDEESGESDSSPKTSPQKRVRPDALVKAIIRPRDLLDSQSQSYHLQASMHPNMALDPSANYNSPKFRSRNQSYMRAVSTLSQASCVSQVSQVSETEINGQFESVCESVFSEVESQAMEALDLPGCFRTRSHSYLRAIQAGYSQDDECIPPLASTVTSTIRTTTDRNYVQEGSCLPDKTSLHEDLAETAPLAHDDLGCPIRRDRIYQKDNTGAKAKPLSGPPVSPSVYRSPQTSAEERPSPKAIQASIKESATLAAAISMQWKEEVSAMRRELADLRKDLCKELRAFNSNFNMFTQHYNTWSPQGGNVAAGVGLGRGVGVGPMAETQAGADAGSSSTEKPTGGAREKRPRKVSVGTQARSKVLVRQSTADAAVNCPDDKEDKKGSRRSLPKQLSMDPSILASPQSMYVESAIPLSLDPILLTSSKSSPPEPFPRAHARAKPQKEMPAHDKFFLTDLTPNEPDLPQDSEPVLTERTSDAAENSNTSQELVLSKPANAQIASESDSHVAQMTGHSHHSEGIDRNVRLPHPVPVVTVSPPEELGFDSSFDSELFENKPDPQSFCEGSQNHPRELDPNPTDCSIESSPKSTVVGRFTVYDVPIEADPVAPCNLQTDNRCPSIVVSEYFDTDSPKSPTDSDIDPGVPLSLSDSNPEEMSSTEPPQSEAEEWPPLPEPSVTAPIYQADLVHFDLVMLTSLDQDDLDSVFMDPEPDPFDLSLDCPGDMDLGPPLYESSAPGSPIAAIPSPGPQDHPPPEELELHKEDCLVPLPKSVSVMLQHAPLPQVTVTISPPSSVSPDTSFEMDFGPTSPVPGQPDDDVPPPNPENVMDPPLGLAQIKSDTESLDSSHGFGARIPFSPDRSPSQETFLWCRWQKRARRTESLPRSASVELWSGRYEYNSAEITYVSLSL